jgi:phospholipase C
MNYFTTIGSTPQLPVTGQLAQSFAVTDSWFGSCPTQTYANRMFLICGTAGGYVDDVQYLLYDHAYKSAPNYTSVFERLDAGGSSPANWKIYFHDLCLAGLVNLYAANAFTDKNNGNICNFDSSMPNPITPTFLADVAAGTLPRFSLIEPRYETLSALSIIANDNHPPHDMIYGEILLATVYNAIRKSAYWTNKNIMLIVTYDEHGGCYDHVAAPAAINPGVSLLPPAPLPHWIPPIPPYKLAPNLFGPRVPTLIISPWVNSSLPSKSAFRPPNFTPNQPSSVTPFDHTSIISTLNLFFNIGTLTQRDAAAPPLGTNVPNLYGDGSNAGPPSVPVPTPPESVVKQQLAQPPTGLGRKLPPMEPPR